MALELACRSAALMGRDEIGDFIAATNPKRALSYIDDVRAACAGLQDAPMMGVARPEFGVAIRILNLWRRVAVVDQAGPDAVMVPRIFGAAQDYEAIMCLA